MSCYSVFLFKRKLLLAFCFAQYKCIPQTGKGVGIFCRRSFPSVSELHRSCIFWLWVLQQRFLAWSQFFSPWGWQCKSQDKGKPRGQFFCKCVCRNCGRQELKDDLTLPLVILNWHWRKSPGEGDFNGNHNNKLCCKVEEAGLFRLWLWFKSEITF